MKPYMTIKEFSKFTGIETSTLRYWDDIGLFSPAIRNPDNNYRCYTPLQMIAVNFVTVMSDLNVPLKKISEIERERDPDKVIALIDQQEKILDMELSQLRERYSVIHTRRELINYGSKIDPSTIGVMYREDKAFVLGPKNDFSCGTGFYQPFADFCSKANEYRINLSYPIGGYHVSMDSYLKTPHQPDHFISMDPTGNVRRPAGDYLVGFKRGYYGEMGDLPMRLAAYAQENNLTFTGPVYIFYLHDEICIKDPDQYLAQACVAVSKNK